MRLFQNPQLKPNHPLLLNQKGSAYSPNTLQDHMRHMLRDWAQVDRASSHSGRRTLATQLLHDHDEHLKTVQQILGHKDATIGFQKNKSLNIRFYFDLIMIKLLQFQI